MKVTIIQSILVRGALGLLLLTPDNAKGDSRPDWIDQALIITIMKALALKIELILFSLVNFIETNLSGRSQNNDCRCQRRTFVIQRM